MARTRICLLGLSAILVLAIGSIAFATDEAHGFFRFPDVRDDLVVFTSEGDLWAASLSEALNDGAVARRLTRHDGQEHYARISPDGEWIAFTGEYEGNADVYVIPSEGGEPIRLTFHGGPDEVVGWTENGEEVIFRSMRHEGVDIWNLFSVSPEGGYPEPIGLDKGTRISFEPNGDRFAYTRLRRENRPWKRYRGGWAMDIWVGNLNSMQFDLVTEFDGTDAFPMWIGNRIYFQSDRAGRMNIFSMDPDGGNLRQHTFNEEWDLRWPAGDENNIVYQLAMDIWAFNIAENESQILNIALPSDRFRARERFVDDPTGYIHDYSIPNTGRRIAIVSRGEVFTFPVDEAGYIRQITHSPTSRESYVEFSPDGTQLAVMSDATDEMEIWLYPSNGGEGRQLTRGGDQWRFPMRWSPDGEKLAFADKSGHLWIVNAENGRRTEVDEAPGEIRTYEWAPDSKWIGWVRPGDSWANDIWFYNTESEEKFALDRPMTDETDLTWDPSGEYLYYCTENWFNPTLGSLSTGGYVYGPSSKLYAVALTDEFMSPFAPELVEAFEEEEEEASEEESSEEEEEFTVTIQRDGLLDRIYEIPVDAGNYFGLTATEGMLYFGGYDNYGMMPEAPTPDGFDLYVFDFGEEEVSHVGGNIGGFVISPDHSQFLIEDAYGNLIAMAAGSMEVPDESIDLGGWSFEINPRAEWTQILRDVWRWQRDFFYDPDMHGVNWNHVWDQYSSLLPRISNREELNDLITEMIGELNVGHAYIWGGDILGAGWASTGYLGCDLEATNEGAYRITRILRGQGWGDEPISPILEASEEISVGDYILAIDGIPLERGDNIYERFVNKAREDVLLTINSTPRMNGSRDVLVHTMGSDWWLRYLDWVRNRCEYVNERSNGRIAYIHMPDMSTDGLSMFGRQFLPQYKKDALIMDIRYNGGGFVAPMVLNTLNREVWSVGRGRHTPLYRVPDWGFYGPMAAICNHEAGSDAETFSEGWKRLEMGELFGTRTWGGWVGIRGGRGTVDGGGNTQPEFSGWGAFDGQWLIEGPGVSPTIEVLDDPASRLRGEDPQLDAAIDHLLEELEDWPELADPPDHPRKPLRINHMR